MSRIAVTGGGGFIGKAVMELAQGYGHESWSCDRNDGCDVLGDLGQLKGADSVIHLAGLLGTHELFDTAEEAVRVNVIGSLRVMQWCIRNDANYVGIMMPDVFPSIYTATKIASARLATALHHSRGLRVSHVRAFNAYGSGQKHGPGHPQKIIPTFAVHGWRNQPIPIWGDGEQGVDLIHTRDLAEMLLRASGFETDEVFDGGTGIMMSVNEVARFVIGVTGSTAGVIHLPMRDGETPTSIVATGEGWTKIGFRPSHNLMWLKHAIESYR